jgi:hypothetical protein
MPSYADSLSVTQLADVVAFIKGQTAGGMHGGHPGAERRVNAGEYAIRLVFETGQGGHDHGAMAMPAGAMAAPPATGTPAAATATPPMAGMPAAAHAMHGAMPAGGGRPADHGAAGHMHGGAPMATGKGHLMAFVVDRDFDEPVPYLPVTATVEAAGAAPRTVTLQPMTGARGFHYGADMDLPQRTEKITVRIGSASMMVMGPARYTSPVTATFEWEAPGQ